MVTRSDSVDLRRMQLSGSSPSSAAAAFLPSREPFYSINWPPLARCSIPSPERYSMLLPGRSLHPQARRLSAHRIAKCPPNASIPLFSSAQAAHDRWSVCACSRRSPLRFSPPPSLYHSLERGGSALAAVLQPHSVFFCSGWKAEVERQGGLMSLCVSERVRACVKVRAAALSLQTSRLCHSCSGGRGVNSCRRGARAGEREGGGGGWDGGHAFEFLIHFSNFIAHFQLLCSSRGGSNSPRLRLCAIARCWSPGVIVKKQTKTKPKQ